MRSAHAISGVVIAIAVWSAALTGVMFKRIWIDALGWLIAASYIPIGSVPVVVRPDPVDRLCLVAAACPRVGGVSSAMAR